MPKCFGRGFWLFERLCSLFWDIFWHLGLVSYRPSGCSLFWLDTCCIPNPNTDGDDVSKAESTRLRIKAINMMDIIYSGAGEVLLDSELQSFSGGTQWSARLGEGLLHPCLRSTTESRDDRITEVLARAFGSNW
jgi:hypothetical protein